MSDPSEFESVTESGLHESPNISGIPAVTMELSTEVCQHCGYLRAFITVTTEEGERVFYSFDAELANHWARAMLEAANDMLMDELVKGQPLNPN